MTRQSSCFRAIALGLVAASAMAQSDPLTFKFSGFGTFGAVHSSEKNADFSSTILQPDGAGFSRGTSYTNDKKVGLQVSTNLTDWLSVTAQGVSEYRYDGTYSPNMTLGFAKVKVSPEFTVRLGRVPMPAYIISDYQKTGYAYTWVRPPVEVYQFNPILSVDGGDITWQTHVGNVALATKVFAGSFDTKGFALKSVTDFTFRKMAGVSFTAAHGNATYRAFYTQFDITADNSFVNTYLGYIRTGLPGGPFGVVPPDPALADQLSLYQKRITYISLGYQYDPGDWFVLGEVARNAGDDNLIVHSTAGYVTGGYRLGNWTPFLMLAKRQNDSATTNPNPIANALLSGQNRASQTLSVGLRWDFMKNLDLKLQCDAVKNGAGAPGALSNTQPAFQKGQSYNLITINLDFVF